MSEIFLIVHNLRLNFVYDEVFDAYNAAPKAPIKCAMLGRITSKPSSCSKDLRTASFLESSALNNDMFSDIFFILRTNYFI